MANLEAGNALAKIQLTVSSPSLPSFLFCSPLFTPSFSLVMPSSLTASHH